MLEEPTARPGSNFPIPILVAKLEGAVDMQIFMWLTPIAFPFRVCYELGLASLSRSGAPSSNSSPNDRQGQAGIVARRNLERLVSDVLDEVLCLHPEPRLQNA